MERQDPRSSSVRQSVSQPSQSSQAAAYASGDSTTAHPIIRGESHTNHGFRYADADFPTLGAQRESYNDGPNDNANHASTSAGEIPNVSITLEERLRGMILKNASAQAPISENASHITTSSTFLPPHMQTASSPEKEAYLAVQRQQQHQSVLPSPPRKRMSQAQRRQLIPDSRFNNPFPFFYPPGNMHSTVKGQMQLPSQPAHAFLPHAFGRTVQPYPQQFTAPQIPPHLRIPGSRQMDYDPRRMNAQPELIHESQVSHQSQRSLNNASNDPATNQTVQNVYQAEIIRQCEQLGHFALEAVNQVAIDDQEMQEKDAFRATLEKVCREAIQAYELQGGDDSFDASTVQLRSFGSLVTGFAVKNSDMDLMLLSPRSRLPLSSSESPLPRLLEKRFLERGWGAQLLTKTRVPIIKLCERPSEDLLLLLRSQREKREAGGDRAIMHESHPVDPVHPEEDQTKQAVSTSIDVKSLPAKQGPLTPSAADLATVSQTNTEDIWRYYQKARNIFGRLENYNRSFPFNQRRYAEKQTVASLTEAFISGLRDDTLRRRVRLHKSLQAENRSRYFRNILLHVGGEEIVMAWERRIIKEANDAKEAEGAAVVQRWRELHEHTIVNDPETERVLQEICNKLRSLVSAKLEMFSQKRDETPEQFYQRFLDLLRGLKCCDLTTGPTATFPPGKGDQLSALIARFINAINDEAIRSQLNQYNERRDPSLLQLHKQHCAESHIKRLEMGVKKGLYSLEDKKVVEECVSLIREHGATSDIPEVLDAMSKLHDLTGPSSSAAAKEKPPLNLEFPKTGVGVQCDINFANHLALHNTQLLHCYSLCDPRVRPMVLCIKAWAKRRKINSPYHGTLSSYGYVLMVLHYLMNLAVPPVLPNLQLAKKPSRQVSQAYSLDSETKIDGYDVHFWRDEEEIKDLARRGELTRNTQSLGGLLRGFFDYYSHQGPKVVAYGFDWTTDVISIRTPGGILTKHAKGWTGAKTIVNEPTQPGQVRKEVRHRYLFAIEDPFELDHNVARTVTHEGMYGIRYELRRAWNMISKSGTDAGLGMEMIFRSRDDIPESAKGNHVDDKEQTILEGQNPE